MNRTRAAQLLAAADPLKDQSYFLSAVSGKRLARSTFPLGSIRCKDETRDLARAAGLSTATKRKATAFAWLASGDFGDFIGGYIDQKPGDVICATTGRVLGEHKGLNRYTIGQRSRICGLREAMFTVAKDVERNAITAAPVDHPALYRSRIEIDAPAHVLGQRRARCFNSLFDAQLKFDIARLRANASSRGDQAARMVVV